MRWVKLMRLAKATDRKNTRPIGRSKKRSMLGFFAYGYCFVRNLHAVLRMDRERCFSLLRNKASRSTFSPSLLGLLYCDTQKHRFQRRLMRVYMYNEEKDGKDSGFDGEWFRVLSLLAVGSYILYSNKNGTPVCEKR